MYGGIGLIYEIEEEGNYWLAFSGINRLSHGGYLAMDRLGEKKRLIVIILLFFLLTSLEIGIFIEVLWHGWGGYGNISKEFTEAGDIGIAFLILSIPVSVIVILFIRIVLYIRKGSNIKVFFLDCIGSLSGMGISIGIFFKAPFIVNINPFFQLGRQVAAFLIDFFNWMEYPMP